MAPLKHEEYLAIRHFAALDGLRAIAAVMVVFSHFGGTKWHAMSGWLGVHMFFVISGYLITTLALREEGRKGRVSLRNFYIRRAFRIMPVYYVVLGATVLLHYLRGEYTSHNVGEVLPYYLTFNNEYIAAGNIFGHSWTLAIEQKFYLVWPLLAFALGALTLGKRVTVIATAMTLLAAALIVPFYTYGSASYIVILIGCLLAVVLHYPRGFALLRYLTLPVFGMVFAVAVVVVQLNTKSFLGAFGNEDVLVMTYGLAVALMLPGLFNGGPLLPLLSNPVMRFIGERSYSLYLVQALTGTMIAATFPVLRIERTATVIAVTVASLIVADVLYRWVELPMIGVGRNLITTLDSRKVAKTDTSGDAKSEDSNATDPADSESSTTLAPARA
ncbi:acyltransferase family protein [Actinokineospora xionganensis]|uniref:Acyltransferase n=1 Tax=Actinokineospora xionganensis TaxID=2684470 RepID=A0ABR7L2F8_9PSEU|nr:acyltransferase [Actinokineospora xionganensis]MBC6446850.1 acyltransferase [Actinokineospora xionganensis]